MRYSTTGSCQSAATSEIVKSRWSRLTSLTYVSGAIASVQTFKFFGMLQWQIPDSPKRGHRSSHHPGDLPVHRDAAVSPYVVAISTVFHDNISNSSSVTALTNKQIDKQFKCYSID